MLFESKGAYARLTLSDKKRGYPHKAGQSLSLKWLNLLYSLALAS